MHVCFLLHVFSGLWFDGACVSLRCIFSICMFGIALKVKKWRHVTDEPLPTSVLGCWAHHGLVSGAQNLCFHSNMTLRFPEVWKWRGVCLARSASVSLLSVDVWGSCVAGWLAPARARLPNRFSFCRLGPCSALSSSCVTFPQHWRRRRGSSFFPDCGRFCLTDNSMWVYISYPALENVVIAFEKFLWKILIKFQGMKKLLSCQSEVSKVGRCCVRESRCADFRMKTKINFVFGFRLWPVRLAHSCAVAVTRCSGIVSQVHWTALWKPCPSASLRFPSDPAFWSTWGKHTTFGFAPH